jgi:hypothetical protein
MTSKIILTALMGIIFISALVLGLWLYTLHEIIGPNFQVTYALAIDLLAMVWSTAVTVLIWRERT